MNSYSWIWIIFEFESEILLKKYKTHAITWLCTTNSSRLEFPLIKALFVLFFIAKGDAAGKNVTRQSFRFVWPIIRWRYVLIDFILMITIIYWDCFVWLKFHIANYTLAFVVLHYLVPLLPNTSKTKPILLTINFVNISADIQTSQWISVRR